MQVELDLSNQAQILAATSEDTLRILDYNDPVVHRCLELYRQGYFTREQALIIALTLKHNQVKDLEDTIVQYRNYHTMAMTPPASGTCM